MTLFDTPESSKYAVGGAASNPATAFFLYDVYAPGPAIRSTPVTVVQASHITDDGSTYAGVTGAETVRRSYTFLDGWGRTLEQHSPAADGSGGRTVTATKYNSLGQVEWVSAPFWNTQSAQIAHGLVNPAVEDLSSYTAYTYDAQGRTIAQSLSTEGDPVATTTTSYGGLVTTVESPNGAQTVATTDLRGRLLSQVQHPDTAHATDPSITTEYLYETLTGGGSRVTVEDAEGNETVFESNMAGQRTTMIDPNSGTSTYTYDLNGQTTKVVSNAGVIRMDYDMLGRMIERRAFAPGIDDTVASNAQSTTSWTFNATVPTTSAMPPLGALTLTSTAAKYTIAGVNATLTTTQSTTAWDQWDRPLTQQVTLPTHSMLGDLSGYSYETTVTYDTLGQVASTEYPAAGGLPNELTVTGYRLSGQAETLKLTDAATSPTWSTDVVTSTSVDGTGLFESRTYGNGVIRAIEWDAVWRVPSVVSAFADLDDSDGFTTGDLYVQNDSFTREDGRVTSITDSATASPVTECFTYDGHNRLASAWQQAGSTCGVLEDDWGPATGAGSATAFGTEWEYSDSGRLLSITNEVAGASDRVDTFTYPAQGTTDPRPHAATEVETTVGTTVTATDTFTYDTAGRQISRVVDYVDTGNPGTTMNLTWDVLSNLTHTSGAGGSRVYVYDASGQRLAQIVLDADPENGPGGTATAYLGATELTDPDTATNHTSLSQLEGTTFITGTRFYTFGGATVAVRTATATTSSFSLLLGDVQGSAQVMMPTTLNGGVMAAATTTDVTIALAQRSFYLPYGATRGTDGLTTINHGWLNQTEDGTITSGGTGLTYLNARYYDPLLSRFLSPDPLVNPSDPLTLDPYRYADNNPVMFTDTTGLCVKGFGWLCKGAEFLGDVIQGGAELAGDVIEGAADLTVGAVKGAANLAVGLYDRSPMSALLTPQRFLPAVASDFRKFHDDVVENGWGDALNMNLNPVFHLLVAGDATIDAAKRGDWEQVGENGFNTAAIAATVVLPLKFRLPGTKSPQTIIQDVAQGVANKGEASLLAQLSKPALAAIKNNPGLKSAFLGQVVHKATAEILNTLFPNRFKYRTKGPDFLDTLRNIEIELTTLKGLPSHKTRPGYENVTHVTYSVIP